MLLDVIRLNVNNGQFKDGLTVLLISCSWISKSLIYLVILNKRKL